MQMRSSRLLLQRLRCAPLVRPVRGFTNDQQQDALSKDSDAKILAILANSPNRQSHLLASRDSAFSDQGDFLNLPGRKVLIGDSSIEPKYLNELSHLIMSSDLKHIFSSSGERKISIDDSRSEALEEILGERTLGALNRLREECYHICLRRWLPHDGSAVGRARLMKEAGVIVSWLSEQSADDAVSIINNTKYSYSDPHCDKANNFDYDIGFLLYLNSSFKGGDFCFMDMDSDRVVQPKAGRFLSFTSSVENIHRVTPVESGNRILLSIWYSLTDS